MRLPGRRPKPRAHFLHIGKTGGTAVNTALGPVTGSGRFEIVLDGHDVDLRQVPRGEKFFFVLRDPVDRFVSSFNDRLRCSRPRYDVAWTDDETRAFELFHTADSLGSALSCEDDGPRGAAVAAMQGIYHVRQSYWDWFGDPTYLQSRLDDLLYVMWLPSLQSSFDRLCELLELPQCPELPTDELGAHRAPPGGPRQLSPTAIENLKRWYAPDYDLVERCRRLDRADPELRPRLAQPAEVE